VLVDDRSSTVSLPEVPLLAVLPGTGGLTRVVDKRFVRRDLADVFATKAEGVKGQQALAWGLVDAIAPRSRFAEEVRARAEARAEATDRPADEPGLSLAPLRIADDEDGRHYDHVDVRYDRGLSGAEITISGPAPGDDAVDGWLLDACRQFDDAMLHLRFNEPELGAWVLRTKGDPAAVLAAEEHLHDGWRAREVRLYWARTLRRLELSARTIITLVEPGSCFAGTLAELVLAADRSFMLDGTWPDDDRPPATLQLSPINDSGWYPMVNGLPRLVARAWGRTDDLEATRSLIGKELLAADAEAAGLVTSSPDDIDWDDEVRLCLEERASFSPDALTGLEANLRFVGPETMESKIFARLTAWQNWIFQRPNAVGPDGALRRYGTGSRPVYDKNRT
jgi:benzoyl-CoA-dihydrodiol lyase